MTHSVQIKKKLKLLGHLILTTPRYQLIIFLQLVSGMASIVGIPMLLPVLEYLKEGHPSSESTHYFDWIEHVLQNVGIQPNFYSILSIACILILLGQLLVTVSALFAIYAQIELARKYRKQIFQAYTNADWLWLVDSRSGEMNFAVLRQVDLASDAHKNAQRIFIYAIQILVFLIIAIKLSWVVTLIAMGVYIVLGILNIFNGRLIQSCSIKYQQQFGGLSNHLVVLQQAKKFLKTSLLNSKIVERIFMLVDDVANINKKETYLLERQHAWNQISMFSFLAGLMFFNVPLSLDYSQLVLTVVVFSRISPNFINLSMALSVLDSNIPAYEALQQHLADLKNHAEVNGNKPFDEDSAIRFCDVKFSYPNGTAVFHGLNVTIEPKRTTAFVGPSGGGKSTLLDLILGLLAPQDGTIYYGALRHDQIDKSSLRSKVAYVTQDTTLIDGTLRENLTISLGDVPEVKLWEVVQKVGLSQVIKELPEGLATPIGENGIKLSGGQRQRVALARALFMEPKILILDEATSSLDAESESSIQETIKGLKNDFTVIIVSHKMSAVRAADMIYVIDNGRISQKGSYEELLKQKGKFHLYETLQKS